MNRRKFLTSVSAGAAAGTLGFPMISKGASSKKFKWKMTTTWPAGTPFYQTGPGSAESFAEKVATMSDGRLQIKVFAAGELVPAFEGFDAASAGTVEMNHGVAYYWAGKAAAAQYFGTVPFGMSFLGQHAWLWEGGGRELWEELYQPFGLVPYPAGCSGVQMTGWFKKPVSSVADFQGLKMRIPGLAGKVYAALGVDVKLLPGGEIFPALERGVIDAAEWVGPFLDQRLGLQNAAKYYYTTGWHEPSTTSEIVINRKAWESLPNDLKQVVAITAKAMDLEGLLWLETKNAAALNELIEKDKVQVSTLPADVVQKLKEATADTLAGTAAKDPTVKKVYDAYFAFKAKHDVWARVSETNFATQVRDI